MTAIIRVETKGVVCLSISFSLSLSLSLSLSISLLISQLSELSVATGAASIDGKKTVHLCPLSIHVCIYMVVLPRQARVSIRDKHMRRKLRKERYYYCCCYCCCCRFTHAEDYWVETCEALGAEPASGLRCALEIRFRLVACVTVVPAGCWLLAWPGQGQGQESRWLLAAGC